MLWDRKPYKPSYRVSYELPPLTFDFRRRSLAGADVYESEESVTIRKSVREVAQGLP